MSCRLTKRVVDSLERGPRDLFVWDKDLTGFGCKVTPAGRKVFVLQYRTRIRGRASAPKRITLGKHGDLTPDEARRLAADLLVQIRAGDDPAVAWRNRDAPTVADLAKRFLLDYLPSKKRPPRKSTIAYYKGILLLHVVPVLGDKLVAEVTAADLERLHTRMRSRPYIANRTLSVLQQAFDQAERWEWRPRNTNPATFVEHFPETQRGAKKEVLLAPEQMSRLLAAIDEEQAAGTNPYACDAIRVAFWTGWRISEVLGLEWANLDFSSGRAKLIRTKTADEEYRSVPAEALAILKGVPRLTGSQFVFPGTDLDRRLTTVKRPWNHIRRRAGLDRLEGLGPLRLHDLRHNVVSWDVSRGVPLEIAGRNVGHRSRRATEVYAHFAPDALKRAADERARAMREAIQKRSPKVR